MFKISFFVPESHKETVKSAMFAAGGGKIGLYDSCAFEIQGMGQFRALEGSQPYLGQTGKLEFVPEYKVEMVVSDAYIKAVVRALRQSHPYETPAYDVFKLEEIIHE